MTSTETPEGPGSEPAAEPGDAGAELLPLLLADDDELHAARTTRALEALYRRMHERARQGLPPDHLEAQADA